MRRHQRYYWDWYHAGCFHCGGEVALQTRKSDEYSRPIELEERVRCTKCDCTEIWAPAGTYAPLGK